MENCLHFLKYFRAIYGCKIFILCTEFNKGLVKLPRKPEQNLYCVCVVGFVFHTTLYHRNRITVQKDLADWTMEKHGDRNVLFYKGRNYVPKDQALRRDIVQMFHDHETAGHPV